MTVTPHEAIDAANEAFGRHPGYRALHAKGTLLTGMFTATPEAADADPGRAPPGRAGPGHGPRSPTAPATPSCPTTPPTRAASRSSSTSPTARAPTSSPRPRRASRSRTPGGVRRAARAPSAGRRRWPGELPLFLLRHPRRCRALPGARRRWRRRRATPRAAYYALHAFRFIDAEGGARFVRYTFVPEAGEPRLGAREAQAARARLPAARDPRAAGRGPGAVHARARRSPSRATRSTTRAPPWPSERRRVDRRARSS